jgi:nitrate/TMAO reductase-like tetraheme cytochrome c subunit
MKMIKYSFGLVALIILIVVSCAKDKTIEPVYSGGITLTNDCPDTISYANDIAPMMTQYCTSCHKPNATYPDLTSYANVSAHSSSVLADIKSGYMPQGMPKLADSLIQKFQCWINQGKNNN